MNASSTEMRLGFIALLISSLTLMGAPKEDYGTIELLRDEWGIPHVFSTSDPGAMYGLGWATAQQRGFQMTYHVRVIQGRLAEVLGDVSKAAGKETALAHDRKMRTFGWDRAAARTASNLDLETRGLLEAYCEGVNDSFAAQKKAGTLNPLFGHFELSPEPWTPAECLLSWWHLAQFFGTDGTRDLMVWRNRLTPRPGQPQAPKPGSLWADDSTAVVQRVDVSEDWARQVEAFASAHGLKPAAQGSESPKFSHAWVVGGRKTTTGGAVLVSDPQTPVRNPSLWMEFHVSGKTIHARGVGVAGSPGLLIGFTPKVAWGLTALGADQADLFRLETSPAHPDQYRWNGQWRPMTVRTERITVRGGQVATLTVRETHLGPVVSAFSFQQPGDPEVALKRVPLAEPNRDTIQGVFAMMRARDGIEFARALGLWRFPSANCVYGDAEGRIGFAVIAAIPVRPRSAHDLTGGEAIAANQDADDWQGFVPPELLPQIFNPNSDILFSANHRPVAGFYPIPLGISTGSMGDTIRSWRLRERLSERDRFSPSDVLDIHFDAVNPARREIVRLALHLCKNQKESLSPAALESLGVLEPWLKAGASSDLRSEGAELATGLSTFFRFVATPLASKYGGGESGLARFLKDAAQRQTADPKAKFDEQECRFVDQVLSQAWTTHDARRDETARPARGRSSSQTRTLGWFETLDGFGSLDHKEDLLATNITCQDGQTIRSQAAQSYTQWVPLHEVDAAQTVCPIGHSDRTDHRDRTSTKASWEEGKLHPAPLSRSAVEKLAVARVRLSP